MYCKICHSEIWYHHDGENGCDCIDIRCPECEIYLRQWQAKEYENGKEVECQECGKTFDKEK